MAKIFRAFVNARSLVKGGLNTMAKSGLKATGSVYGYERDENKSLKMMKIEGGEIGINGCFQDF